jgi:energy-coupling factor transporter transmembrane protein EcfT
VRTQAPGVILAGVLWAAATWWAASPVAALLTLLIAIGFLFAIGAIRTLGLRAAAALTVLGFAAHLLSPGSIDVRLLAGFSTALRLVAMLAEGRAVYALLGPGGVAQGVGRLASPLSPLGVRPQDAELMVLVALRLLPAMTASARNVWLGRRYLGRPQGMSEWGTLASAWIATALRQAGAAADALIGRGLAGSRRLPPADWRGLRLLWLPAATMAVGLAVGVR